VVGLRAANLGSRTMAGTAWGRRNRSDIEMGKTMVFPVAAHTSFPRLHH